MGFVGDVSRFLTPLDISPKGESSVIYKSSAFVSPIPSGQKENEKLQQKKLIVDRVILEKYLSEALHRYQASGEVVALCDKGMETHRTQFKFFAENQGLCTRRTCSQLLCPF